jgi:nucleolar complex protein 3
MMEKGRKRGRSGSSSAGDDGVNKPVSKKQQRRAAAASKTPYFTPKPATSIACIDVPLERLMPQKRIELIADLSESILEDPSTALSSSRTEVSSSSSTGSKGRKETRNKDASTTDDDAIPEKQYHKTQSKMHKLLELASLSTNGHDAHAARLALLSLLAIFQDILPSDRIRLPTEAELNVRVSKDVKQTWDYERKLLQAYQRYLQLLEKTWEDGKFGHRGLMSGTDNQTGPPTTLAATSIIALSQLLQTSYQFNFRSNIIQIVVRQANNQSSDEVRLACCHALSVLFTKDVQGDASLEAVRRMAKMVKDRQHHQGGRGIHPDVLNTWLSLPLRVHEDEAMAAKIASQVKKKRAKKSQQDKDTVDIENEMKEGEATVDKLELAKNQADTLHTIVLTYFRILKVQDGAADNHNDGSAMFDSKLLPCALRGLAKFSHLIHLDAVVDLLEVLKTLLEHGDQLSTDTCVHCILCAMKTLRGPGRDTIPVDVKQYLMPLYGLLPRVGLQANESSQTSSNEEGKIIEEVIQCLDHAFLQRRELSSTRLAGFVKRLTCSSLHCTPTSSVPLLACTRQIVSRYASSSSSKIGRMLENEEDIVAEGVFAPEAEDPEHSNSHSTSLWELSLLRYHIHPMVADHSFNMASGKLLKLPGEAPAKLCTKMKRDAQEGHIDQKAQWKNHPLNTTAASRKRSRKRQNQVRFITPRKTASWHLQTI